MGEEWELIDEVDVDYELEQTDAIGFASGIVPIANRNRRSEQDTEIIKCTLYRSSGDSSADSRDFVKKMVSAKPRLRKEDMNAAGVAVNPDGGQMARILIRFGCIKGGDRVTIFGSVKRTSDKNNKRISVNQAKKLIREAGVDAKRLEDNDQEVAQRPGRYAEQRLS